jgi:hypothetical protein
MTEQNWPGTFEQGVLPHLDSAYNLARWLMRNEWDAQDCRPGSTPTRFPILSRIPRRRYACMAHENFKEHLLYPVARKPAAARRGRI